MKKKFKFTNASIKALPANPKDAKGTDLEVSDTEIVGLKCLSGKNGSKRFLLRYTFQSRKCSIALGRFPEVDVGAARRIASKYKLQNDLAALVKSISDALLIEHIDLQAAEEIASVLQQNLTNDTYGKFHSTTAFVRKLTDDIHSVNATCHPTGHITLAHDDIQVQTFHGFEADQDSQIVKRLLKINNGRSWYEISDSELTQMQATTHDHFVIPRDTTFKHEIKIDL